MEMNRVDGMEMNCVDYHQLSQLEIGSAKRSSRHLFLNASVFSAAANWARGLTLSFANGAREPSLFFHK